MRFHPQYPLLASASEDATIKLFDSETGQFERTLKGHTNAVQCVAWSPTGALLASSSADLSIKIFNTETFGALLRALLHDCLRACVCV